ncbi:hypothetical protein ACCO45_011475 [Purpureocillium lilacinum]|uniref:Uncharacterized protein n=1 Tax=Purpureocillium lilacinum TaxID=33203 RepID=A0ACC4DD65_PURLI
MPSWPPCIPPQLRLQQVQILLRHGERTPVNARFTNTGLAPFWPYCSSFRNLRSAILDPAATAAAEGKPFSTFEWKRRLETFGANDAAVVAAGPKGELDGMCDMGMLTDRGRETTLELGQRLRRLYDTDFLYLRATPIPRALESMQQTFHGLYPPHTRAPDLPPPMVLARTPSDETLFPNDGNCRRFAALSRAFAQRAADRWNDSDDMAFLNKRLGKWMPDDSPKVAVDARPRLSGIMDTINATKAHGPDTRLPSEFYDPKVKQIVEKIGVEEWFAGYKENREYRTLGIGGLLADVVSRMVGSAEHTTADGRYEVTSKSRLPGATRPVQFGLSGCHDTTLAAALSSLGAFNTDAWPPFTSHIAIELFRHAETPAPTASSNYPRGCPHFWAARAPESHPPASVASPPATWSDAERAKLQGYYVRVRYNDQPVTVPGCKAAGKHLEGDESFCTLEAFKSIVDKFTPRNWKAECRANVKAPAFPAKEEPAGF